jgi:uncharacterized membrane protein YphA (DoxX/SURF4 family)
MATTYPERSDMLAHERRTVSTPIEQAYRMLHVLFAVVPIIAGADKFFNLLVRWHDYLAPSIAGILPIDAHLFMYIVGLIEICAGVLVAVVPRIGAVIVGLWLLAIAANLLVHVTPYYDIAVRDVGLAVGAFALARLASAVRRDHWRPARPSL